MLVRGLGEVFSGQHTQEKEKLFLGREKRFNHNCYFTRVRI